MAAKGKNGLTHQQQTFVDLYLSDPEQNATAAYREAYPKCSPKSAEALASKLLRKDKVAEIIQKEMDERSERTNITKDRVLEEIAKLAFGNIQCLYDEEGSLLPPHQLPTEVAATVTEVTSKVAFGDDKEDKGKLLDWKYKIADKGQNLERLGRHLKLFTDKTEHSGPNGEPIKYDLTISPEDAYLNMIGK